MSRYYGNNERCPYCGIKYRDFRCTTYTSFQDVKDSLWVDSKDSKDWKYKRLGTVLGRWHMAKKREWEEHIGICERQSLENCHLSNDMVDDVINY